MTSLSVAIACDSNYDMQAAAVLSSLAQHHAPGECTAYILHDGYTTAQRSRVESGCAGVRVEWLDAIGKVPHGLKLPSHLPAAAVFRILLPELLPSTCDRVIYLDSDVVVRAPLLGLWDQDLAGHPVGAVRGAGHPWVGSISGFPWRELGLAPTTPHFNSGVLLLDLDAWRRESLARWVLDCLARERFGFGDQGALNVILANRWLPLLPTWNLQTAHLVDASLAWVVEPSDALDDALRDPHIVHFVGRWKPWVWMPASRANPWTPEWFDALDKTAWSGWRPGLRTLRSQAGRVPAAVNRRLRAQWR